MSAPVGELEVRRPKKLRDALLMLRDDGPLQPLAGGTDLLVLMNAGALPAGEAGRRFLDLWALDELRGIRRVAGKRPTLEIGALATFTDCIRSREIGTHLPILAAAAREVGGAQIQNRGTVAGNVGNGSPAADSLPVLAAADTTIVLASADGEREVPLDGYYTGYRKSVRRPDELIVRIRVAVPHGTQHFRKVGTRAAQAISKVVMAAIVGPRGHRVAFGSVAPTVIRARAVEAYLDGGGRDLGEAQRLVATEIHPIDDVRSTAVYRLRVAQNLLAAVVPWS
jgi:CO/xanthine dehydrogenase FAD-binding subunit